MAARKPSCVFVISETGDRLSGDWLRAAGAASSHQTTHSAKCLSPFRGGGLILEVVLGCRRLVDQTEGCRQQIQLAIEGITDG